MNVWRPPGTPHETRYINFQRHSGRVSVPFVACIASNGQSFLTPLENSLNMVRFRDILEHQIVPWIESIFPNEDWRVLMDNCPAHVGHVAKNWMRANYPGHFGYLPPKSPDANLIEKCFAVSKNFMHRSNVSNTRESIIERFTESWQFTIHERPLIPALYNEFPDRLNEMIAREGRHTSYL